MAARNRLDLRRCILLACLTVGLGGSLIAQNNLPAGAKPATKISGVPMLPFVALHLPKKIRYEGQVVGGAKWQDSLGMHYFVISSSEKGTFAEPGYVSALAAAEYLEVKGHLKTIWKSTAQSTCCMEALEVDLHAVMITDLDADGTTESFWGYRITPDGEDPERAQLVMHIGKRAFEIHGQFAGSEEDKGNVEKMQINPAFAEIAPIFTNFARQMWNGMQRRYYQSWPQ
jgi:hypothetical protein